MIYSGLVSVTFRRLDPDRIIRLVERAGLAAIEWGGDIHVPHGDVATARSVKQRCRDAGIETPSYGSYFRLGVSDGAAVGAVTAVGAGPAFDAVLDSAEALGSTIVRIWAGDRPSADVSDSEWGSLVEEARSLGDAAAARGLQIGFEYHANTLTDTNESAVRLLHEIDHPAVRSYWQPRNAKPVEYSLAGLESISAWLAHLHVFNWITSSERFPLADGIDAWTRYLNTAGSVAGDRYAMLEFVKGDSEEQFVEDADTLVRWLRPHQRP